MRKRKMGKPMKTGDLTVRLPRALLQAFRDSLEAEPRDSVAACIAAIEVTKVACKQMKQPGCNGHRAK